MDTALGLSNIEANAPAIVSAIGSESVAAYVSISELYLRGRIDHAHAFQAAYRRFYRLDNAGLTPAFKSRYFQLLESLRGAEDVDMRALVWELYALPNRKGQQTLQFSFVTKMANTVNPTYPIYDSLVASVFGFQPAPYHCPPEARLEKLIKFYGHLRTTYEQVLDAGDLQGACGLFREKYMAPPEAVSDIKVLDFIFWSAGRLGYKADLA